jgi:DNA repair protein RadC
MGEKTSGTPTAHERLEQLGPRALSDAELVAVLLGPTAGANNVRDAALRLLDARPLAELAWATPEDLQQVDGIGRARAAAIVAAFELGRRGAWSPPRRGERLGDPARVYELLRDVAHAEREQFHVVLLDVRCRLIKTVKVSEGSLTQCPVAPRDVLREPLRAGAHGVIFVHNHPSGVMRRYLLCAASDRESTSRRWFVLLRGDITGRVPALATRLLGSPPCPGSTARGRLSCAPCGEGENSHG